MQAKLNVYMWLGENSPTATTYLDDLPRGYEITRDADDEDDDEEIEGAPRIAVVKPPRSIHYQGKFISLTNCD